MSKIPYSLDYWILIYVADSALSPFNFTQSGPGVQCLFANVWYLLVLFCVTKVTKCMDFCFRVLKSKGMSVGDAAAVWFLSVLGSTASAAMPIAPHLRDLILSHTR